MPVKADEGQGSAVRERDEQGVIGGESPYYGCVVVLERGQNFGNLGVLRVWLRLNIVGCLCGVCGTWFRRNIVNRPYGGLGVFRSDFGYYVVLYVGDNATRMGFR
jgi:hypothetical protein